MSSLFFSSLLMLVAAFQSVGPAAQPSRTPPHYEMRLQLNPASHSMSVDGTLTLPPQFTGTPQLDLGISRAAGDIAWSSVTPGVTLRAERRAEEPGRQTSNPSATDRITWRLSGDWAAGATVKVRFRYQVTTQEPDGFLYLGPEIAFGAGGWYPAIAEGKPTSVLDIQAPRGSVIAAGGRANAPSTRAGWVSRRFVSTVPGELFFAVSPPGSPRLAISPTLALQTLRPRPTDSGWRRGLRAMQEALEEEFGPLPFPAVTVIEVPDAIADKAGFGAFATNSAVITRSQLLDQPFNVAAFAHEFAHLWWGIHIGLQGRQGDFLLDEGLAQYGSMVAVDRVLGTEAGANYRRRGVPGFNESLYSALGYLRLHAAELDRPLLALEDDGLSYWIAYSKAGLAWYALAEDMGRANFRSALREIANRHGAGYVSWLDFVAGLQRHSRSPLSPFMDAWFAAPGAPAYELEWRQQGEAISGRILQTSALKPATLELEASSAGGAKSRYRVRVGTGTTAFEVPARGTVRSLVLDPDYRILRWTPELRSEATALAGLMRALALSRLGRNAEAEAVLLSVLQTDPADNRYDRLLRTHATLAQLAEDRNCAACAVTHIEAALSFTPTQLAQLAPSYLGMAQRARRLARPDLASRASTLAIAADALVGNANGAAMKLALPVGRR